MGEYGKILNTLQFKEIKRGFFRKMRFSNRICSMINFLSFKFCSLTIDLNTCFVSLIYQEILSFFNLYFFNHVSCIMRNASLWGSGFLCAMRRLGKILYRLSNDKSFTNGHVPVYKEFDRIPLKISFPQFSLQMRVWFSTDRLLFIFYDVFIAKNTSDIKIEAKSMGKHIYYRVLEAR